MSPPLPFRATINASYATFFKEPVRFTLLALPAPIGFALCIALALAVVSAIEDGVNLVWEALAAFALEYALFIG